MVRRIAGMSMALMMIAATAGFAGLQTTTDAQDATSNRVAALETQVASLEERIDNLERQPVAALIGRVDALETQAAAGESAEPTAAAPPATEEAVAGRDLHGLLTIILAMDGVRSVSSFTEGQSCTGRDKVARSPDYSGIRPGTRITVRNEDGATIATGSLGSGSVTIREIETEGGVRSRVSFCQLEFVIEDLRPAEFYSFSVSGVSGEMIASYAELEERGWRIELTLRG